MVIFAVSIGCKRTDENTAVKVFYSNCQAAMDSIYSSNQESIGIMLHIESPKNNLSWSGSSGFSTKDQKIKLESDQPALIASSAKTYVSASILRLQELGLLTIDDPISKHLTEESILLFEEDGYDFNKIKIKHLLSHTSGIKDFVDKEYLDWIDKNPKYRWSRQEQLKLAIKKGDPLGNPEEIYNYADVNYLLCSEILESNTNKPFYTAIRDLLKYEELGFRNTWFPTLEKANRTTKPMVHQYWSAKNWDSYNQDISYDLFGGGGIATTTEELAKFSYNLFQGNIIEDSVTLNKMYTRILPPSGENYGYCLGLREGRSNGIKQFGHEGFWGTNVHYFPDLETSISVYILDKDKFQLAGDVTNVIVKELMKHLNKYK